MVPWTSHRPQREGTSKDDFLRGTLASGTGPRAGRSSRTGPVVPLPHQPARPCWARGRGPPSAAELAGAVEVPHEGTMFQHSLQGRKRGWVSPSRLPSCLHDPRGQCWLWPGFGPGPGHGAVLGPPAGTPAPRPVPSKGGKWGPVMLRLQPGRRCGLGCPLFTNCL